MAKVKHFIRTCVVTKKRMNKFDLIRFVKTKNGEVRLDDKYKMSGRGASVSMDMKLIEVALQKGILARSLKLKRALSEKEISDLLKQAKVELKKRKYGKIR